MCAHSLIYLLSAPLGLGTIFRQAYLNPKQNFELSNSYILVEHRIESSWTQPRSHWYFLLDLQTVFFFIFTCNLIERGALFDQRRSAACAGYTLMRSARCRNWYSIRAIGEKLKIPVDGILGEFLKLQYVWIVHLSLKLSCCYVGFVPHEYIAVSRR